MFNYENLPEGMSLEEVRRCLTEFLFDYQNVAEDERLYAFEQLLEISERETYELLDEAIILAVSDFVISNINYEDFEIMDIVLSIIPALGLKKAWDIILEKRETIKNTEVVKMINECNMEYGDTVADPYSGYRNLT